MNPETTAIPTPPSAMWAFIDEYGNTNIATEKEGVSDYFIVAAVLVRERDLPALRAGVEEVRSRVFQTGEMKSKNLASDRTRWMRVLEMLAPLPFRFYGLAVDKTRLARTSGFQWKQSFYKNLCGRAYGKLMRAFPDLHIRADEHGDVEFKESFARYIRNHHQPTLFEGGTFAFVDGKSEVVVQLADILAGLLARVFDPKKKLPNSDDLLACVKSRVVLLDEWPVRYRLRSGTAELPVDGVEQPDTRIAEHSIRLAEDYVEGHEGTVDEDVLARVAVLERLLFERRFGDSSRAVATGAILDHLHERGFADKGETWLRRSVIAPLRDARLLLTSSSHGYKLPDKKTDILAFIQHAESICVPMLNRVSTACEIVKLATVGDIDVLAEPGLEPVRRLVESMADAPVVTEPVEP